MVILFIFFNRTKKLYNLMDAVRIVNIKVEFYGENIILIRIEGICMAQGLFGGMTSYEDQSIADILEDINYWIDYTKKIKDYTEEGINKLKESKFWNQIPFDFQVVLSSSIRSENTILHDLELIVSAITQEKLSEREVKLMKKIGINANEYNADFGRSYKEDFSWKKYGDESFQVAEKLYEKGRDYFVTLQDASNAAGRLIDYIVPIQSTVNNNIQQTINGNHHVITGNNSGTINNSVLINVSQFSKEIESVLNDLQSLNDIDNKIREYTAEILKESNLAVQQGDLASQNVSKTKMKSFLIGAGANGLQLAHLLGTYASIASYFNL